MITSGASKRIRPRATRRCHPLGVEPVGGEVGPPLLGHRLEQPARSAASRSQTKRTGRVWCGAGAVSATATAARIRSGSTGAAANCAHRTPQQHRLLAAPLDRLGGAEPEQVVGAAAHQIAARGAVVGDRQSTHHGNRYAAELALHQIGGGGQFVRDRDLR